MKKLMILLFVVLSINLFAQSIVDPYEARSTAPTFSVPSISYNGEFMINHSANVNGFKISYSFEVVSFPFMPAGFNNGGDANLSTTVRELILPEESTYGPITCGVAGTGYGWVTCLYQKTNNIAFKAQSNTLSGAAQDITLASNSFMSGSSYTCSTTGAMYLPHTVLRININYHLGSSIDDPIVFSTPYYVDNTRGRMRDYPFSDSNITSGASDPGAYDLLFIPTIDHNPNNNHLYSTTSNSTWVPSGGTINYFPPFDLNSVESSNPLSQTIYPTSSDINDPSSYYDPTNYSLYNYPAPYCLPSFRWLNATKASYVGFEDDGTINPGITHTYIIDKSMDLSVINPIDKVIFNPSEADIDIQGGNSTLTFPTGYTFKTINGLHPTLAMVNATDPGNLYRDKRKVNVSNSGFPSVNQHKSVYHVKDGSTLIIEPCVTLIDVDIIVEDGGYVDYNLSQTTLVNSSIIYAAGVTTGINANYVFTGVYACKQDCYIKDSYNKYLNVYNQDIQISQNTTWTTTNISNYFNTSSSIVKVPGKITVQAGKILTIEEGLSFQFSEVGKIIVEKGAKLIVNGEDQNEVEFTSACNNMWEGIEVWGDETISQYANPHSETQQGYLELHYTKVSNAITGVLTGERDHLTTITDKTKAGGLIKAYNCTFENNGTSIEFFPFKYYFSSTTILPNYSMFEDCSFKTTALLNDQALFLEQAGTQIILNQIHFYGSNIKNCTFYTDKTLFDPAKRGVAIEGYKSSLRLFYSTPSSFEGFTEAILIKNSNDGEKVYVDNCTFEDNIHSIVLDGVSYARIYRNDIDVQNSEDFGYANSEVDHRGYDNPVGIYMRFCIMNDLQNNRISGNSPSSSLPYSYGIITNSTTGYANTSAVKGLEERQKALQTEGGFGRIYNNTISNFSYAIQGELNNGGQMQGGFSVPIPGAGNHNPSSFLPQKGVGEQFKCNAISASLESDVFLIGIEVQTSFGNIPHYGEFRTQGICKGVDGPAGNSFYSPIADFNLEIGYYSIPYDYNYYNNHNTPSYSTGFNGYVNKCSFVNSSRASCIDLLSEPCTTLVCVRLKAQQNTVDVETYSTTVAARIDAGSTTELITIIDNQSDITIYNALIAASPYLSDEVLLALINKETPIIEAYFEAIIIQNCGLSDIVISALEEYDLDPSIRDNINEYINLQSERSVMYAELENAKLELNFAIMDLINFGLDNSSEYNNSEILDELEQDNSLSGKYRQFDWCMQTGNTTSSESLLNSISVMEGNEKSNRYKLSLINFQLIQTNYLTSEQDSILNDIINEQPYSSIAAQSLLRYYSNKQFERTPYINSSSNARIGRSDIVQDVKNQKLRIFPNPTEGNITISFNEQSTGVIEIRSISGSIIRTYNVLSKQDVNLNVSDIAKGVYIIVFLQDNKATQYSKLLIQ